MVLDHDLKLTLGFRCKIPEVCAELAGGRGDLCLPATMAEPDVEGASESWAGHSAQLEGYWGNARGRCLPHRLLDGWRPLAFFWHLP